VIAASCLPDIVLTIPIMPGTLRLYREMVPEGGPLVKGVPGSLTLVAPRMTHGHSASMMGIFVLAICSNHLIPFTALGRTYFDRPEQSPDYGYMPDASYYIQSHGKAGEGQPPDLAIEVVVTHSPTKALMNGVVLGITEMWVWNLPRKQLIFHHLVKRGRSKKDYVPASKSLSFPFLSAEMALERLSDPTDDAVVFFQNCCDWAARVLAPIARGRGEGAD
jgi:hypothetical protein